MSQFRSEVESKIGEAESVVFDFQLDSVERLIGIVREETDEFDLIIGWNKKSGTEIRKLCGEEIIAWTVVWGVEERGWVDRVLFGKTAEVKYVEFVTKDGPVDVRVPKAEIDRVSVVLEKYLAPYVDEDEMKSIVSSRSGRKQFPLFPPLSP